MKKPVVFAVACAFLAAIALYAAGGLQTIYAAVAYQCTKCGLVIHSDPHDGGYDPSCSKGGIHAWIPADGNVRPVITQPKTPSESSDYSSSYKCTKCGLVLHSDPHDGGYDPSCPNGGIHAWVPVD